MKGGKNNIYDLTEVREVLSLRENDKNIFIEQIIMLYQS